MQSYREFIDGMVEIARRNVITNRIALNGHPLRTNESALPLDEEEEAYKALFLSLSPQQREVLTQFIITQRRSAVHDVLAHLEWAVQTDNLIVQGADGSFAEKPEATMHHDFISRIMNYPW